MKDNYSITKSELLEILLSLNLNYSEVESKTKSDKLFFKIKFKTDSDLIRAIFMLNNGNYNGLFGKIGTKRIDEGLRTLYVVPFKT